VLQRVFSSAASYIICVASAVSYIIYVARCCLCAASFVDMCGAVFLVCVEFRNVCCDCYDSCSFYAFFACANRVFLVFHRRMLSSNFERLWTCGGKATKV